jgi:hypothetical protein
MCVKYQVLCVWLWVSWKSIIYCILCMVNMSCMYKVLNFKCVCCIWCVVFVSLGSQLYLVCGFFVFQKFNVWFINCLVCFMCWLLLMCIVCQLCVLCFILCFKLMFSISNLLVFLKDVIWGLYGRWNKGGVSSNLKP